MSEESGTTNESGEASSNDAAMEKQLEEARAKLAMLHELQHAARVQTILLVLVLVAIVLIFGFKTFTTAKENLSYERFEQEAMARWPMIQQDLQRQLTHAATEAWPIVKEQATARVKTVMPELREDIEKKVRELPDELQSDITTKLEAASNRVGVTMKKRVEETFPYLAGEDGKAIIAELALSIEKQSESFTGHVGGILTTEQQRMSNVLTKFPVPKLKDDAEVYELEKQFARELVKLVDIEIQAIGTEDELSFDQVVKPSE